MSNNKQSSVEWLFDQLEEKGGAWENASIRRVEISIDVSEYLALKEQAKAMHKEEMEHFFKRGMFLVEGHLWKPTDKFAHCYHETYGGSN